MTAPSQRLCGAAGGGQSGFVMKQPLASISAVLLIVGAPAAFVSGATAPAGEAPAPVAAAPAQGNVFAFARQSAHPDT